MPLFGVQQLGITVNGGTLTGNLSITENSQPSITLTGYGATPVGGKFDSKASRGTQASPTKVLNSDNLGRFSWFGAYDVAGVGTFPATPTARIVCTATEDWNDSTHLGSSMIFSVTPAGSGTIVGVQTMTGTAITSTLVGDQAFQFGSSAGIVDTTITNKSLMWVSRALANDQNEFIFSAQMIANTFSPTAHREKAAIEGYISCKVASGAQLVDCVGILGNGVIQGVITTGRVWGMDAEAQVGTAGELTDDGLAISIECGIVNYGTAQTAIDTTTSKYNIWLASHMELANTVKATAGLCFSNNTAGWQYGFYMRQIVGTFIAMTTPAGGAGSTLGIDIQNSANWSDAIRIPNASAIKAYNSTGASTRSLLSLSSSDVLSIGVDSSIGTITLGNAGATPSLVNVSSLANATVASDVSNTTTTQANITGLSFSIGASQTWTGEICLVVTGPAGGVKFQLTGPASPTSVLIQSIGDTSSITSIDSENVAGFSTVFPVSTVYCTSITGLVWIKFTVVNGANAGTVQAQFACNTAAQTSTVKANSYMRARRTA